MNICCCVPWPETSGSCTTRSVAWRHSPSRMPFSRRRAVRRNHERQARSTRSSNGLELAVPLSNKLLPTISRI